MSLLLIVFLVFPLDLSTGNSRFPKVLIRNPLFPLEKSEGRRLAVEIQRKQRFPLETRRKLRLCRQNLKVTGVCLQNSRAHNACPPPSPLKISIDRPCMTVHAHQDQSVVRDSAVERMEKLSMFRLSQVSQVWDMGAISSESSGNLNCFAFMITTTLLTR